MSSVTETSSKPSRQGPAGSRLANLYESYNPKTLLRKDIYVSSFKSGVVGILAVISILALYSIIAIVTVLDFIKSRRSAKTVLVRPPGDFELEIKTASKPVEEVGLNMDDVQEIPGEVEFAAMKDLEVMPAPDQIPEINDEPQEDVGSSDEHEATRHFLSDDDSTLIGHDEVVGVKGSPVLPTIKDNFERPISPPATPPTGPAEIESPTVDVVEALQRSEEPVVDEEPSKMDVVVLDKAANSVEAAVKAVEEHAKIVEDAISPTDSMEESYKPSTDSPVSEFVVVPSDVEEESKKPVEVAPVPPVEVEVAPVPPVEAKVAPAPPVEVEVAPVPPAAEPAAEPSEPANVEPTPAPAPVPEVVAPEVAPAPAPEPEAPVVALVDEPESLEVAPALVEEPKVEEPKVEEVKVVEEPKVEEPKAVEAPKETPPPVPPKPTPSREGSIRSVSPSKPLGRPRVMRRATGATSATAGVTTTGVSSPAPATVTVVDDKATGRDKALRRADDALNMLAGSILRSNTIDRLPPRPASPTPSSIPRAVSPANVPRSASPVTVPRSASPANLRRSESPSSDAAGSRPSSPAFGIARRGSVALANGARPTVSRQSTLNNVTNAPEQPRTPPAKKATFANTPRGGSTSPPPMPLPPQRQASQGTSPQRQGSVRGSPQVPQAAVMSPSVLSRKATIDSNGSPGSPPPVVRRPPSPTPPASRPPAEEFTTSGTTRRNVPFPSAPDGNQPVASAVRPRPRPRTSTTSSTAPTAPNTLQASLLATLNPKVTFPTTSNTSTTSSSGPNSNVPSPVRSDSFASAVSNRDSILSFSDTSDMDMSTSDLDFSGRQGHRMGLGARYDSMGSMSSDGGMSGNEEEKRAKRAKRRAKARAQAMKKQKRSKRN